MQYSTILNNLGPYNAVTFPTLFPFNRMTFIYRNSSENIYVVVSATFYLVEPRSFHQESILL